MPSSIPYDTLNRTARDTPWGVLITSIYRNHGKTFYDIELIKGDKADDHFDVESSRIRSFKRLKEKYG